jgi:hypothetical protein
MLTTDVLKNERGGIERRIVALRLDLAQAEGALKFLDYLTEKSKAAEPSEDKPSSIPADLMPQRARRKR